MREIEIDKLKKDLSEKDLIINTILEYSLSGYWDWHIKDNYEYLSPTFKKMFGYGDHEMSNHPDSWMNIIHPDDLQIALNNFEKHVQTKGKHPFFQEVRYFHKNGDIIWVICQGRVVEWDEEGNPVRAIGVHVDITPLKDAHQKLIEAQKNKLESEIEGSNNYKYALLDVIPDLIFVTDKNLVFKEYRADNNTDLYISPKAIIGKSLKEAMPENIVEETKRSIELINSKGQQIATFNYSLLIENTLRYYEARVSKIGEENYLFIIRDFTKRKEQEIELMQMKEKAEESNRLKSAFLANMSHEIRTPLNAILGYSDLIGEPDFTPEEQKNFIKITQRSGCQLLSIINNIIDLSKIETGQIELNLKPVSFNDLLSYLYLQFKHQAAQKGVELVFENGLKEEDTIITDDVKVKQILTNLINNALKFTENGWVEVRSRLAGEFIEVVVEDTGIGIPKAYHSDIFNHFRQVEESYTRKYEGNGLGLSISKGLVQKLGGTIHVESDPGRGARFTIMLPYKKTE